VTPWAIVERLGAGFGALAFAWEDVKLFIQHSVAFSQDAIHVVVGAIILLVAALVLRKPVSSIWPWLVVLLFASLNELIDLWVDQWPERSAQLGEGARDLLLTLVVPTLILLSARLAPQLYRPPRR
jgi:diacylglycerol kinase